MELTKEQREKLVNTARRIMKLYAPSVLTTAKALQVKECSLRAIRSNNWRKLHGYPMRRSP